MAALNMRISGFFRLGEMGRTRPNEVPGGGVTEANRAALGALGNAANTAGLVVVIVFSVVPSKLRESSTTLLNASMVTSAKEALNSVPLNTSQVKPTRGCQLLPSEEQAGISPLPCRQVPLGPWIFPPCGQQKLAPEMKLGCSCPGGVVLSGVLLSVRIATKRASLTKVGRSVDTSETLIAFT